MWNRLSLRLLILCILWLGLGLLARTGKMDRQLVGPAVVFSLVVLAGFLLEHVLRYTGDPYVIPTIQAVMALGLVFLVRIRPEAAWRQFWWANLGLVVFYIILWSVRDYRQLGRLQYLWGLAALSLLLITLLFGVTSGGATSWLRVGNLGFEPEELVKVALLFFLAAYLSEHREILKVGTVQIGPFSLPGWRTLGPFLAMAGVSLGLLAAQKSLGTALEFYVLFVLLIYIVTERSLYLGLSLPVLILTGTAGYLLFGHVRLRVDVWLHPWQQATGGGYQIAQSLFAIGGGKILGTGLGNGIGAFMVPAASTDFIFAIIAEELGFAGAMAVLCLFVIIVLRAFAISMQAGDNFGRIMAAGIGVLIGTETLIILLGVTKLLPLTGIPLPWVSYGGSSLIVHFVLLGFLANISHSTGRAVRTLQREYAG